MFVKQNWIDFVTKKIIYFSCSLRVLWHFQIKMSGKQVKILDLNYLKLPFKP